jgi:putative glutamine amidotransferase
VIEVGTWLRPCDRELFAAAFAPFPDLVLRDAARDPVDLEQIGGLLLTGGEDVSLPWLNQPVPDPSLIHDTDPARDAWEFPAARRALDRRLPVLAICRGHQLLNVAMGGTLHLDLPGHALPEQKNGNIQPLVREPGAFLSFDQVNSSHHQAVAVPGAGLRIEARSVGDGVIEEMRAPDFPFVVGVQYHPERDPLYAPLFAAFATAVRL